MEWLNTFQVVSTSPKLHQSERGTDAIGWVPHSAAITLLAISRCRFSRNITQVTPNIFYLLSFFTKNRIKISERIYVVISEKTSLLAISWPMWCLFAVSHESTHVEHHCALESSGMRYCMDSVLRTTRPSVVGLCIQCRSIRTKKLYNSNVKTRKMWRCPCLALVLLKGQ